MQSKKSAFKFRRHDTIGAEGAEQDIEYLRDCFVDTGDLAVLRDTRDPRRIVVGRTGAGKSALLLLLARSEERVASVEPEQLALNFLSNSTILRHLENLGVNLDVFYRLLWRHVLAVELIQLRWNLRSEGDQQSFFIRLREMFRGDKRKEAAMQYLQQWGEHFWKDTEYRIHEVTSKFEAEMRAKVGAALGVLEARADGGAGLSVEDKREIVHRAQEVVHAVQIQKLSQVLDILAEEVFADLQQRYFVILDRLDENWVADGLRFKLIRALMETVKDLQRIVNAKIVVAIRRDLLQRVFRETRDAGFQEEKYQALYLPLKWSQEDLLAVMDRRLNKLIQRRYSGAAVSWRDVFPSKVNQIDTGAFLVERTLYRPRDIIQLCNCCIDLSVDREHISAQSVRDAESTYSTLRFRGLGDEWAGDYPELLDVAAVLTRRPPMFAIDDISAEQLDGLCLHELESLHRSRLREHFTLYYDQKIDVQELRHRVIGVFYEVGLVGIKRGVSERISWSFLERDVLRSIELLPESRIAICPVFHRVLGTDIGRRSG